MTWRDYSYQEKVAILHSIGCVAMADGRVNYSENEHIMTTAMRIDINSYQNLISDSKKESIDTMISTLKNMSSEKKEDLGYLWMDCARHSRGGSASGNLSLEDYPEEQEIILELAKRCNVKVKESYTFYD